MSPLNDVVRELPTGQQRTSQAAERCLIFRARTSADRLDFAEAVVNGLSIRPRQIHCRFLYDQQGSALFEQICRLPEYYLTRTEAGLLTAHAAEIAQTTGPVTIVELGSGSASKTGPLLSAYRDQQGQVSYIPVDVSESAIIEASRSLADRDQSVQFLGIHGSYEEALPLLSATAPNLVLFLGSTIGNMDNLELSRFLTELAERMQLRDFFLLGVDLVKSPTVLEAAYNDAAGVTARFTRNLFARMNRELGSNIDLKIIEHVAAYNRFEERVDISARFRSEQRIDVQPAGKSFRIMAGEEIKTEISRKFRVEALIPCLESFGFRCRRLFMDRKNWLALMLLERGVSQWK